MNNILYFLRAMWTSNTYCEQGYSLWGIGGGGDSPFPGEVFPLSEVSPHSMEIVNFILFFDKNGIFLGKSPTQKVEE